LDGGDLIGSDIRRDFNLAFQCPILARAAFVRGIATGRPGARGIFTTRGLNENVGPGNPVLLHEVFDGEVSRRTCFERCAYCRGAVVCHVNLSFLFHYLFKRCWHRSGFTTMLFGDLYFGDYVETAIQTLRPEPMIQCTKAPEPSSQRLVSSGMESENEYGSTSRSMERSPEDW
jgi:hypothetical protein